MEIKVEVEKEKKIRDFFFIYWVRTHWLGAMLWTKQKLGAMLYWTRNIASRTFRWIIHLRLYSGP